MQRPILLVKTGGEEAVPEWRSLFARTAPQLDVRWIDDPDIAPEQARYAFVWAPAPGRLAQLPNLRLILSSGAGVDHLTADPACPRHVPIVRMGGEETGQRMGEYVCLAALALLRDLPRMIAGQRARCWEEHASGRTARDVTVGIMGLGNLGVPSAQMLQGLGFKVAGWSRSEKSVPGVACFAGPSGLAPFLAGTGILVNLLPDTAETRGLIDAAVLGALPRGAGVVNAGRGPQLVLDDLLAALDAGQVGGAVLDVFEEEPLPPGHAVWAHERVIVTPHVASMSSRPARAQYVADVIAAFERGEGLPNLYDPERGY
jgi:glyoxylate/hydroxypyruvate reductase A